MVGFWIVGIPSACVLVFWFDAGIFGLWLGMSSSLLFVGIFYFIIISRSDLKEIAYKAYLRKIKDKPMWISKKGWVSVLYPQNFMIKLIYLIIEIEN